MKKQTAYRIVHKCRVEKKETGELELVCEKTENHNILETKKYTLQEVSKQEVLDKRFKKERICILKINNRILVSNVDYDTMTIGKFRGHLCSSCAKCSPRKCIKVACFSATSNRRFGWLWEDSVKESNRIERFSFIETGIETVNLQQNGYAILRCKNYEKKNK